MKRRSKALILVVAVLAWCIAAQVVFASVDGAWLGALVILIALVPMPWATVRIMEWEKGGD